MSTLPKCPTCSSEYTYEDGDKYVCPECAHEWPQGRSAESASRPTASCVTPSATC